MAGYWPPGFPFIPPPPPPRSAWSLPPPRTPLRQFSPKSRDNNTTSPGGVIAAVVICVGAFLLVFSYVCSRYQGNRNSRADVMADAASTAKALAVRPREPPRPEPWDEEQWLRHHRSDHDDGGTQCASTTASLPSFTYNQAVSHNVTGSGDEAATCSICLGLFQVGDTVRLLPVCLHLYHVECIDPWLEAHSTCPLCRSGTDDDPTMHGGLLPPV